MKISFATLLLLIAVSFALGQNEQSPIVEKDFAYKDWTYKNLKGEESTNLRVFSKGKKLVMIVYWAPWCPNWKYDVAFVQGLHEKYKDQGLAVIGVGMYDAVSQMRSHAEQYKITFPLVYDSEDREAREETVHFAQRRQAGDMRKWGSPWYVFLNPTTMERGGEVLTKKTSVVNGELIKPEAERSIQQKLGVSGPGAINSQVSGVKTEYEDINKVLDLYVIGLQKGDMSLLQQAFFSEGQFCMLSIENDVQCQKFAEVLSGWVKWPDLNAVGKILSQELQGLMARVTFKLNFDGKVFIDYLTMYKSKNGWTIVAKTTWIQK